MLVCKKMSNVYVLEFRDGEGGKDGVVVEMRVMERSQFAQIMEEED